MNWNQNRSGWGFAPKLPIWLLDAVKFRCIFDQLVFGWHWAMTFQHIFGIVLSKPLDNLFPFCTDFLLQCADTSETKVKWNESRVGATRILNFLHFHFISCKSKKSFQDVLNFSQNWVTITFWKSCSETQFREGHGCFNFTDNFHISWYLAFALSQHHLQKRVLNYQTDFLWLLQQG